nr:molybdopterin-dependent oxidoreductase [Methylogaea oryzae]
MIIKTGRDISAGEITDEKTFRERRKILKLVLASAVAQSAAVSAVANATDASPPPAGSAVPRQPDLVATPKGLVETYNNYYEFSFDKGEVAKLAQSLSTQPWSVEIAGEVERPGVFGLEDLLRAQDLREYVYRFRCVEAWSMVVPWIGFPLAALIKPPSLCRAQSSLNSRRFSLRT